MKKQIKEDIDKIMRAKNHIEYTELLETTRQKYRENGCILPFNKEFGKRNKKNLKKAINYKVKPTKIEMITWVITQLSLTLQDMYEIKPSKKNKNGALIVEKDFCIRGKAEYSFVEYSRNLLKSYFALDVLVNLKQRISRDAVIYKGTNDLNMIVKGATDNLVMSNLKAFSTVPDKEVDYIIKIYALGIMLEILVKDLTWEHISKDLCDETKAKKINRVIKLTRTYLNKHTDDLVAEILEV